MKRWVKLALVLLFTLLLRYPVVIKGSTPYFNIDENEYLVAAQKIVAGGIPYKDFLIYQPPIIFYIYAASLLICKGAAAIMVAEIIAAISTTLTAFVIYLTVKSIYKNEDASIYAALLYGIASITFIPQDMLAANCEVFLTLPFALSILLLCYGELKTSHSWIYYILAGIFGAVATLTKYQGGVILGAELAYLILIKATYSKRWQIAQNLVPAALVAIGALIPLTLIIAYFYYNASIQYAKEAFEYITIYAKGPPQNDIIYLILKFLVRTFLFMLPSIYMWIPALLLMKNVFRGKDGMLSANRSVTAFVVVTLLISFAAVTTGGRMYYHYFIILLPSLSVAFGIWYSTHHLSIPRLVKTLATGWIILNIVGWNLYAVHKHTEELGITAKTNWIHVANFLKASMKDSETLFVWGYCPQLYTITGLGAATRFTTADYLTGRTPMSAGLEYDPNTKNPPSPFRKLINDFIDPAGVVVFDTSYNIFPKAWEYLKEDFQKKLPTYIVDTSPSNYRRYGRYPIKNFPYLDSIIKENYTKAASIQGYDIYQLKEN